MMKPSKLSAINIATASETVRTMQVSVSSVMSKIDSNRSSKTGSGFRIRTRVSTKQDRGRKLLVGEQESCPFQRWQWCLTHPGPLRRRRGKRVRCYLMRSAEMNFSDLRKHLRPMLFDDRGRGAFDFT